MSLKLGVLLALQFVALLTCVVAEECFAESSTKRRGTSQIQSQIQTVFPNTALELCPCSRTFEMAAAAADQERGLLLADLGDAPNTSDLGQSECEPFCEDNECPCLRPWAERCLVKSCSACGPCTDTQIAPAPSTAASEEELRVGTCSLIGDPHIKPFDWRRWPMFNFFKYGDYWIVKSTQFKQVWIQGRYYSRPNVDKGNSMIHKLAIGGTFINNNVIIIDPRDGAVSWNGQPVDLLAPVTRGKVQFEEKLKTLTRRTKLVDAKILTIDMPKLVVVVQRWASHLNVYITMSQLPDGQDGHCGNFDGDETDDLSGPLQERMGEQIDQAENLFPDPQFIRGEDQPQEGKTLDDCDTDLKARVGAVCKENLPGSSAEEIEACTFDACFSGEDMADQYDPLPIVEAAEEPTEQEHSCPDGLPQANAPGACTDIQNPLMQEKGTSCKAQWIIRDRCNQPSNTHHEYWKACQFCAQSCFEANLGYDGLNCSKT